MKPRSIRTALSVSLGYFLLVMFALLWYELSLGKTESGGLIPGLVLGFITIPGLFFEGLVTAYFNCPRYSTCEHVIGTVFAGGVNTIFIFFVFYGSSRSSKGTDET